MSSSLLFGDRSLGEVLMRPLLPEAGGTIAAVERWGPSAIERKLMALERRRAKLVPMLANVDEMIRLMKRTGLH
jgi:hypothetical protein